MDKFILHIPKILNERLTKDEHHHIHVATKLVGYELDVSDDTVSFYEAHKNKCVVLASEDTLKTLCEELKSEMKSNVVACLSGGDLSNLHKGKDQLSRIRFILGRPFDHLSNILLSEILFFFKNNQFNFTSHLYKRHHVSSKEFILKSSSERINVQDGVYDFFMEEIEKHKQRLIAGCSSHAKNLSDVVDEFIMNGIWDANPKYTEVDRTIPISLLEQESLKISCMSDGSHFSLKVSDPFGTFGDKAIERNIRHALGVEDIRNVNQGPGGAGIGLIMTLHRVGSLIFQIDSAKSTSAYALALGTQSIREMQKRKRNILFFKKSD